MRKERRPLTAIEVLALRRDLVPATQLQKIGKARLIYVASLRSGWDDYARAIEAAQKGNVSGLVDCLRGRKPLPDDHRARLAAYIATKVRRRCWQPELERALSRAPIEDDFDVLANCVEETGRRQGRKFDDAAHRAARLVETMLSLGNALSQRRRIPTAIRSAVIDYACELEGQDSGVEIDPERVRNLLDHPKARAHKR